MTQDKGIAEDFQDRRTLEMLQNYQNKRTAISKFCNNKIGAIDAHLEKSTLNEGKKRPEVTAFAA